MILNINKGAIMRKIKIALIGNPNTGKTTFINAVASTNLHVGNWPGVTIEKKEAIFKYKDYIIELVDLPGIYSLSNNVAEEKITIEYLLEEKPDLIINILDATNLDRNLYLTLQLLDLEIPMIIAVNMCDEAEAKGLKIDYLKLAELLGVPVIPISAKKGQGVFELLDRAIKLAQKKFKPIPRKFKYRKEIEEALEKIRELVLIYQPDLLKKYPKRFLLMNLLEGHYFFIKDEIKPELKAEIDKIRKKLEKLFNRDISEILVEERYSIILGIYNKVVSKKKKDTLDITFKLDRIFLNTVWGFPIFFLILWLLFNLTFELSTPYVDWLDNLLSSVIVPITLSILENLGVSDWFKSFIIEGVIGGVGFVVVFIPVLFFLYFFMALLEESGYMSRVAFLMDRIMSFFGLNGKAFIPLILGFGCNVPAVYATRTLEDRRSKILTVLLIPFMSCGARLTVFAFFTTIFFKEHKGVVLLFLYILGVFVAGIVALILSKFVFKSSYIEFILELPPYRLPNFRYVFKYAWLKTKTFIYEAGTFILATSIVIWFLLHFPFNAKKLEDSLFASISKAIAPVFEPLGFGDWKPAGALISGFVAKEVVLTTMGNIYSGELKNENLKEVNLEKAGEIILLDFFKATFDAGKNLIHLLPLNLFEEISVEEENDKSLIKAVKKSFTPLSALSFMVFLLLYTPCMATLIAIKHELGGWRWALFSLSISFISAWITSFIVYRLGSMFIG
jgi:ferrous iron transport protein B